MYVDIWVRLDTAIVAIELKYKTHRLLVALAEETFDLRDQSAPDSGRYDFVKDIERLEQITSGGSDIAGYAILLTNDSSYWSQARHTTSLVQVSEFMRAMFSTANYVGQLKHQEERYFKEKNLFASGEPITYGDLVSQTVAIGSSGWAHILPCLAVR